MKNFPLRDFKYEYGNDVQFKFEYFLLFAVLVKTLMNSEFGNLYVLPGHGR